MDNDSAVPAWILQILPKWFLDRPAFTEAAYAFALSIAHSTYVIGTVFASAAAADGVRTFTDFYAWFPTHWFVLVLGFVAGGGVATSRAATAHSKAIAATR